MIVFGEYKFYNLTMKNFKLRPEEKRCLLIAFLIALAIFMSSAMTYQQQKIPAHFLNQRLSWLEHLLAPLNFYYGGHWHNATIDGQAAFTQFVLRKAAHFISYFCLAFFLFWSLKRIFRLTFIGPMILWLSTLGIASLDEFHQFLTGDRTPSIHDVMLDGCGALLAIVLSAVVFALKQKGHSS